MSNSLGLVIAVAAGWATIGVVLAVVMGRRGHSSFTWLVLGVLLGPLALILAVDARRHDEVLRRALVGPARSSAGTGPVDVLVGYDGSPESVAASEAAIALLGDRLGRLTIATVVAFDAVPEVERQAKAALRQLPRRHWQWRPELEVLHGHPSSALLQRATEGGYQLIAVGSRGAGITRAILGSAASELARQSKLPVLLVGDHQAARTVAPAWAPSRTVELSCPERQRPPSGGGGRPAPAQVAAEGLQMGRMSDGRRPQRLEPE